MTLILTTFLTGCFNVDEYKTCKEVLGQSYTRHKCYNATYSLRHNISDTPIDSRVSPAQEYFKYVLALMIWSHTSAPPISNVSSSYIIFTQHRSIWVHGNAGRSATKRIYNVSWSFNRLANLVHAQYLLFGI